MLNAILNVLSHYRARTRAIATLNGMDDHRLRDIGIARDQIELFVAGKL